MMFTYNVKGFRARLSSDKVYQLLAHCRWFSPGTRNKMAAGVGGLQTALILIGFIIHFQPNFNNNIKVYDVRPQGLVTIFFPEYSKNHKGGI